MFLGYTVLQLFCVYSLLYVMLFCTWNMFCTFTLLLPDYYYYYYFYYIIDISFMQVVYTYIPVTNHVPRGRCVAAILMLLFMVLRSLVPALTPLYLYVSTFRSMCGVPNMAVLCSSLTSWFPGVLLTYFLNDFEMVPVAPIITGITFVFKFHMRCISVVGSLYFRNSSASFLIIIIIIITCG